jgi:hypothetical protein
MDVEAFLIADAATDQFGKLNVLGSFDAILAPKAPVVHPHFSVALRIRFSKSESANHPFRINIVNQDGKSILPKPVDGNVNVQIQQADESVVVNLVGNFRDVKFNDFGRYSVDLTMDGKQRGSLPLYVKQVQQR